MVLRCVCVVDSTFHDLALPNLQDLHNILTDSDRVFNTEDLIELSPVWNGRILELLRPLNSEVRMETPKQKHLASGGGYRVDAVTNRTYRAWEKVRKSTVDTSEALRYINSDDHILD